jgi:putative ABC transport system ATP-binding protein
MNVIETKGLTKVYDDSAVSVTAVNGVSLSFEEGEFTSVVGPSGCGKTTFLNMIGGLDEPTEGKAIVAGVDLGELSSRELTDFRLRNIGFVFQAYNLIPVFTARENVEFIMQMRGMPEKERKRRAEEVLTAVGLGDRLDARPAKLSGGQQQRVSVARALAPKPKFIIADEPTANLDSKSTGDLLDMMLDMNREEKVTFIFSTHDRRVTERARRLVTLEDGKVKKDETR